GVANLFGDPECFLGARCDTASGTAKGKLGQKTVEAASVLGPIDGVRRRSEQSKSGLLQRNSEFQRGLASELNDDPFRLPFVADRENVLEGERLEVESVRRVIVGGDGLRVAVAHHCLVAELAERLHGVHAAVVEFDALTDMIRATAENDHLLLAG